MMSENMRSYFTYWVKQARDKQDDTTLPNDMRYSTVAGILFGCIEFALNNDGDVPAMQLIAAAEASE